MKDETISALCALFAEAPFLAAGPLLQSEVESGFSMVNFKLPEDYLWFVKQYGGAVVGAYSVCGLRKSAPMGVRESSALEMTSHFKKQGWPGVENWLIISSDHSGNPIGIAADGQVWISDYDNGQVAVISSSFEQFIREWCLVG